MAFWPAKTLLSAIEMGLFSELASGPESFDALPEGGAFVVYESIIDNDHSQNAFALMMSLNMLIETTGGFDFTGADCEGWMLDAGFREVRTEVLVGPESMVVAIK